MLRRLILLVLAIGVCVSATAPAAVAAPSPADVRSAVKAAKRVVDKHLRSPKGAKEAEDAAKEAKKKRFTKLTKFAFTVARKVNANREFLKYARKVRASMIRSCMVFAAREGAFAAKSEPRALREEVRRALLRCLDNEIAHRNRPT